MAKQLDDDLGGATPPEATPKKGDLKLFGEIEKRVSELSEDGKVTLVGALEDGITVAELRLIEQVAERYAALTDKGREYVNGTLGVHAETE